jgi:hypothetical protein
MSHLPDTSCCATVGIKGAIYGGVARTRRETRAVKNERITYMVGVCSIDNHGISGKNSFSWLPERA